MEGKGRKGRGDKWFQEQGQKDMGFEKGMEGCEFQGGTHSKNGGRNRIQKQGQGVKDLRADEGQESYPYHPSCCS